MSLFLRFASVKCPRRTISSVQRFYWRSHSFTFREGLAVRYFIPRTANTPTDIQTERVKDRDLVPEEFKLIYNFSHENVLSAVSCGALGFAIIFIYFIFNPNYLMELDEQKRKEENEPISEEVILQDDDYTSSTMIEKITKLPEVFRSQLFYFGDPKAKSIVGLTMTILFFYIRSRCVLTIYRHNKDFITVFYQAFGYKKKLINHRANDCSYYPKRKLFNYNLLGRNVIIFSELFVNHEEEQLYIGRRSQ